jgi:NAD(P)-dependent dehydrogenase (short-subunit alcohol dehydrogenase family)
MAKQRERSFAMSTPQQPIGSGFTAASTAEEVISGIDLAGRTAIVTGGYSGLGRETARVLRNAGAEVIVPARDLDRAKAALEGIDVAIEKMDLLDPATIDAFAEKFLASGKPLHILVNSAAIMAAPLARDARGYETQFSTNHLGHFQLSTRLWPALQKAEGARIVSVSSWGHRYSDVVFDDPNFERRPYDPWQGYGQSKTANALFAVEADARGKADGIRAFSLHPGAIAGTGLEKHVSKEALREAGVLDENDRPIIDPSRNLKTVAQGAATSVWCAVSPALDGLGGVYCENVDVAPLILGTYEVTGMSDGVRALGTKGVMAYAVDSDSAKRLWALSERLIG